MGIPRFASWITKKFPNIVKSEIPTVVHGLYIDMNGIIHPCCHSEDDASIIKRSEEEKIAQVCLAVNYLLMQARPKTIVYLAMDGVAPRAKMNQQRSRRYMSAVESHGDMKYDGLAPRDSSFTDAEEDALMTCISRSFPSKDVMNEDSSPKFDSNCISPGTIFMERCADALSVHVQKMMAQSATKEAQDGTDAVGAAWAGLTVIISDTSSPGEGEHKIVDFIRSQLETGGNSWPDSGSHVIAGKDADLILLCLAMHTPRIYIMRENFRLGRFTEDSLPLIGYFSKKSKCNPLQHIIKSPTKPPDCNNKESENSTSITPDEDTPITTTFMEGAVREAKEVAVITSLKKQPGINDANTDLEENDNGKKKYQRGTTEQSNSKSRYVRPRFEYYDVDMLGSAIMNEIYTVSRKSNIVLNQAVDYQDFVNRVHNKSHGQKNYKKVVNNGVSDNGSAPTSRRPPTVANFLNPDGHIEISPLDGLHRDTVSGHVLVHPCTTAHNSRVIDDFIALASLMGNDFMPRLPSAFCGDSAMDNIIEVYIHTALPYGYITNSKTHDLDLKQFFRFLVGYAKVETVLFRQQCIKSNLLTPYEAMNESGVKAESLSLTSENRIRLPAPIDAKWRDLYYSSTSITNNKESIDAACKSFIEGMRFVFRYYTTTSKTTSWTWYYPFHHTPFAADLANFLEIYALGDESKQQQLPPPKLEVNAPYPFAQLMAILPPTSAALVPKKIAQVMCDGARCDNLKETFPLEWKVDYCASSWKDYLSTVMIPFANLDILMNIVEEMEPFFDDGERIRNKNNHRQKLLLRCSRKMISTIRASAKKAAEKDGDCEIFAFTARTDSVVEISCRRSLNDLMKKRLNYLIAAAVNEASRNVKGVISFVQCRNYSLDTIDCAQFQELGFDENKELTSSDETGDDNSASDRVLIFDYEDFQSVFHLKPKTYSYNKSPPSEVKNGDYVGNRKNRRWNKGQKNNCHKRLVQTKSIGYNVPIPTWFLMRARACILSTNRDYFSSQSTCYPSFGDFYVATGGVVTAASVLQSIVFSYLNPDISLLDCLWSALVAFSFPVCVFITGLFMLLVIGFGQSNPLRGSGIVRNNIRDAYVDWLCAQCLALNFSKNEKCFHCGAPCDELRTSWAIFSAKGQNTPPNLAPDHAPYITSARICMSKAHMFKAAGLAGVFDSPDEIHKDNTEHKIVLNTDAYGNSYDCDNKCDMI
eukprot:Tbor_TRINITY_DN4924_c0_g1::TRINITY_DN4924_c0_g1_i1::g.9621::m.9621/K12619/XRN2, RAT1; 5'-3' exoribonuclease 2